MRFEAHGVELCAEGAMVAGLEDGDEGREVDLGVPVAGNEDEGRPLGLGHCLSGLLRYVTC